MKQFNSFWPPASLPLCRVTEFIFKFGWSVLARRRRCILRPMARLPPNRTYARHSYFPGIICVRFFVSILNSECCVCMSLKRALADPMRLPTNQMYDLFVSNAKIVGFPLHNAHHATYSIPPFEMGYFHVSPQRRRTWVRIRLVSHMCTCLAFGKPCAEFRRKTETHATNSRHVY